MVFPEQGTPYTPCTPYITVLVQWNYRIFLRTRLYNVYHSGKTGPIVEVSNIVNIVLYISSALLIGFYIYVIYIVVLIYSPNFFLILFPPPFFFPSMSSHQLRFFPRHPWRCGGQPAEWLFGIALRVWRRVPLMDPFSEPLTRPTGPIPHGPGMRVPVRVLPRLLVFFSFSFSFLLFYVVLRTPCSVYRSEIPINSISFNFDINREQKEKKKKDIQVGPLSLSPLSFPFFFPSLGSRRTHISPLSSKLELT